MKMQLDEWVVATSTRRPLASDNQERLQNSCFWRYGSNIKYTPHESSLSASVELGTQVGGAPLVLDPRARFARGILVAVAALLAAFVLASASSVTAAPRRSYFQLVVIINDSNAPDVRFTFWLDSPYPNDPTNYSDTTARSVNLTTDFGPELAYEGVAGGTYYEEEPDVTGDLWLNVTTRLTTASPGAIFTTVYVNVTYTDDLDERPRTIHRFLNFAINYDPPEQTVNLMAAAAAGLGGAGVLGIGLYVIRRARLEELYLMHDSGMLIRHWSRSDGMVHDSDIMSGMFIVLQEFVRDSFDDRQGSLEQLRFGQRQVLMVRGQHTVLAAVIQGRYLNALPAKLQRAVFEFERTHADILARWDGNVALLPYADAIAHRFIRPRFRLDPN